jgi:TolB-like protein/Tfp pilus assembly protein PilF
LALLLTVIAGILDSDIREWMLPGTRPRPRIESIAVLPLANLSGDDGDEYFADGMTDALISNLAQISALRVISRQSVMQFRDSKESLSKIAQLLKVDAVLQGAVVRAGNHVRVTAQLIDSDPERHLWAGSYERDFSDVIGLQNEVAREVAGQVAIELTPEERLSLSDDKLVNAEAHEAFLKGKWHFEQLTPQGLERAIEYYRESVTLAPDWAPPYAALSACYTRAGGSARGMEPSEAYASARDMAERALKQDPNLAEAHLSLASILAENEWNFADAEREYRVAVRLAKGGSVPHQVYAEYLSYMARHHEAIAEIEYAVMRDPVSIPALALLGRVLTFAGQNDRAIAEMERALELHRDSPALYFFLRNAYKGKGSYGKAIEVAEKYVQLSGADAGTNTDLAVLYALNDDRDRAREILDRKKQRAKDDPLQSVNLARISAALGDDDQALEWLEQGFRQRSPFMITINAEPDLKPLRNDARFQDLLRRMSFPPVRLNSLPRGDGGRE